MLQKTYRTIFGEEGEMKTTIMALRMVANLLMGVFLAAAFFNPTALLISLFILFLILSIILLLWEWKLWGI